MTKIILLLLIIFFLFNYLNKPLIEGIDLTLLDDEDILVFNISTDPELPDPDELPN